MPLLRAPTSPPVSASELRRILKMEVPIIVKLAERKLTLAEVMRLGPGALIELTRRPGLGFCVTDGFRSGSEVVPNRYLMVPIGTNRYEGVPWRYGLVISRLGGGIVRTSGAAAERLPRRARGIGDDSVFTD